MPTVNYYYYYTSLKASFSRTTWVSRYQKGKTSLHINEARFWYGSGIRWTVCKQCAPRFRQITTSTSHQSSLNFYRPHALPDAQTTVSEQWRHIMPTVNITIEQYTHTHLTALCPGLPRWAGTRKVKTNLDFTEARDSEWQWHQLGHMQVCTSLQAENYARTPPLSFLQAGCPSCRPTNSVKALKAINWTIMNDYWTIMQCKSWH